MKANWGLGISLIYAAFAAGTAGVVVFAMKQPVDLVTADYYAEALKQDEHAAAADRAKALGDRVSVSVDDARIAHVQIPFELARGARGTVTFYRASDARADRVSKLAVGADGAQQVRIDRLVHGPWKVKLDWTSNDVPYYFEAAIWIQ